MIEVVITLILRLMNFPTDLLGQHHQQRHAGDRGHQARPGRLPHEHARGAEARLPRLLRQHPRPTCSRVWPTGCSAGSASSASPSRSDLSLQVDPRRSSCRCSGITVETLWTKLGEHIGPDRVAMIRRHRSIARTGAWAFIKDVQENGIGAIWRYVTDQLGTLGHAARHGQGLDHDHDRREGHGQAALDARPDRHHGRRQQLHRLLQRGAVGDRVPPRHPRDRQPLRHHPGRGRGGQHRARRAEARAGPGQRRPGGDRLPRQPGRASATCPRRSSRSSAGCASSSTRRSTG